MKNIKEVGHLCELIEAILIGCPSDSVVRHELSKGDGRTVLVSRCDGVSSPNVTHKIAGRKDAHSLAQYLLVDEKQAIVEMSNGLILRWTIEGERGVVRGGSHEYES